MWVPQPSPPTAQSIRDEFSRHWAEGLKAQSTFWVPPSAHSWGRACRHGAQVWLDSWAQTSRRPPSFLGDSKSPESRQEERGTAQPGPAGLALAQGCGQQNHTGKCRGHCPVPLLPPGLNWSRQAGPAGGLVRQDAQGLGRGDRLCYSPGRGIDSPTILRPGPDALPEPPQVGGTLQDWTLATAYPPEPGQGGRGLAGPGGSDRRVPPPVTRARRCYISGRVRACASCVSPSCNGVPPFPLRKWAPRPSAPVLATRDRAPRPTRGRRRGEGPSGAWVESSGRPRARRWVGWANRRPGRGIGWKGAKGRVEDHRGRGAGTGGAGGLGASGFPGRRPGRAPGRFQGPGRGPVHKALLFRPRGRFGPVGAARARCADAVLELRS